MDKVKQMFKSDADKNSTTASHAPMEERREERTASHNVPVVETGRTSSENVPSNKLVDDVRDDHRGISEPADRGIDTHRQNVKEHHNLDDISNATHDHKHLAAVTREKHHEHEVEEVVREREHDRHIHHVQHHVQPVLDEQHKATEHHEQVHPVTNIREQHVNTDEDKKLFAGLNKFKDEQIDGEHDRVVVDKGEKVRENISHHVHHVVQPVIERDTHHHKTIHTVIPVKHTTHEAPIVHQSSTHEPMKLSDFVAQGGDLKSTLTHDKAGVLATGNGQECARDVDGPAESLAEKLHLGNNHHHSEHNHNHNH